MVDVHTAWRSHFWNSLRARQGLAELFASTKMPPTALTVARWRSSASRETLHR